MSSVTSSNTKLNCGYPDVYVTDLSVSHTQSKLASALSNDYMMIYDLEQMTNIFSMKVHKNTINSIQSSKYEDSVWFSCSSDKTWKMLDTRIPKQQQQSCVLSYSCQDEINSFALSFNDNLIALAHVNSVTFIDIRIGTNVTDSNNSYNNNTPKNQQQKSQQSMKVGYYEDIHSDQIHNLKFSPTSSHLLITASEDGLICTHDTRIADAEECTISTLNIDCPVRTFGFFGPKNQGIYCLTTIETMSLWHNSSAQKLSSFDTIRTDFQGVDYLIDCFESIADNSAMSSISGNNSNTSNNKEVSEEADDSENDKDLLLLAGSYTGQAQLFNISPDPNQPLALKNSVLNFNNSSNNNSGGSSHSGVIRASVVLKYTHQIITGGEDGLISINSY